MTSTVACPECGSPVDPKSRFCGHCRVDLAMAAAIAEQTIQEPVQIPSGAPMTPEVLVPRLGDYLVQNGLLSREELKQALEYQLEKSLSGRTVLIGQALRELGMIDADTLDKAVTVQILNLQRALQDSNRQLEKRVRERTRDLQEALAKLTELNQLKANFIANISHELRTPLTHLKGYLDLLSEGSLGELNETQRGAVAVLQRSENRLERLIENLIQFSMASKGELQLDVKPISLRPLVCATIEQAVPKADLHRVKLQSNIPGELPRVQCDGEKISWVMNQLIDNAIKFTPENGTVKVGLEVRQFGVEAYVTDTGIGIPPDRMLELFEPFHQLDGSATRHFGGTGLGLALTNRILAAHNSKLEVKSKDGKGSRFSFILFLATSDDELEAL